MKTSFTKKNERRIFLIRKQSLTDEEESELEDLSEYVLADVNERHPLPFDELEEFKRRIDEALRTTKEDQS